MADHTEKYSDRQYELVAVAEIAVSDITAETEERIFELPAGAVITGFSLQILTAFDGTPTFDVGLLNAAADCFLDGVSGAAVEAFGESLFGGDFGTTNGDGLDEATTVPSGARDIVTLTLHATNPTLGLARLIVKYVVPGRSIENQG